MRVFVDFIKTCGGPGILNDVVPKMVRANPQDPNSPQVQGSDSEGNLKWTASVSVPVAGIAGKYETWSITLTSKTKPCANVELPCKVVIDDLEQGTMKAEKTGFTHYYSASAIRPVRAQAPVPPAQPPASR